MRAFSGSNSRVDYGICSLDSGCGNPCEKTREKLWKSVILVAAVDFFVSYTKVDRPWAEWISWELENAEYQCILQAWDFAPGTDFIASMRDAMNRTQQTVAVLSPAYLASDFAAAELNAALAKDPVGRTAAVVPVRIVDFEPPDLLRSRVYVDLAGLEEETARRRLIEGVKASRAVRTKPVGAVRFPRRPTFPNPDNGKPRSETGQAPHEENIDGAVRLLFLASDAGLGLDLAGELERIQQRLTTTPYGSSFDTASRLDVAPEDFLPMLDRHRPHIFHFSGNFTGSSITLTSRDQGVRAIPFAGLVGLFRSASKQTRLAVLNACESLPCAKALAELFGCAIGVEGFIYDGAAIEFADAFYGGLSAGKSVQDAFDRALADLHFRQVVSPDWPQLVVRPDVDASQIRFCG